MFLFNYVTFVLRASHLVDRCQCGHYRYAMMITNKKNYDDDRDVYHSIAIKNLENCAAFADFLPSMKKPS